MRFFCENTKTIRTVWRDLTRGLGSIPSRDNNCKAYVFSSVCSGLWLVISVSNRQSWQNNVFVWNTMFTWLLNVYVASKIWFISFLLTQFQWTIHVLNTTRVIENFLLSSWIIKGLFMLIILIIFYISKHYNENNITIFNNSKSK